MTLQSGSTSTDDSTHAGVLVVDDDPRALKLMTIVLERAGYCAITARDAQEGRRLLADLAPDVVIADLMMPDTNGIEFLDWVRRRHGDHRPGLMLLTAMDTAEMHAAAAAAGVDAVMTKPIDRTAFLHRLEGLMSQGRKG
jgi:two-component system, NtrC family, response regulator GlrR